MSADLIINEPLLEVLYKRWANASLSDDEQALLDGWLREHAANGKMLEEVMDERWLATQMKNWRKADNEKIWQTSRAMQPVTPVRSLLHNWIKYAAAVIVVLGIGAYLWNNNKTHPKENTATIIPSSVDILPGGQRAILTLADGRQIFLDSAANGQIALQNGNEIIKRDGQIIYGSPPILSPSEAPKEHRGGYSAKASQAEAYNTMSTPRGGQYQLILSDGTRVWLNAASSITYPAIFSGNIREVKISGEVYFEVKTNKRKPFIVKTISDEITVLGTSFNINAYPDEVSVKISLAEGSIKVSPASAKASVREAILKPGQAYQNGEISATDISQDIAWKNGYFNFNGADLKMVMRQLGRWYDVEIIYAGDIAERKFRGKLSRDLTLAQVLNILRDINVNFEIKGKTLLVK